MDSADRTSFRLLRALRITRARDFELAYGARMSRRAGPLVVHARPNGLGHARLGMSIPRRVGGAVVRNRVRRRLREAFRRHRHEWPGSYDVVVNVRPHEPLDAEAYARLLGRTLAELDAGWRTRQSANTGPDAGG